MKIPDNYTKAHCVLCECGKERQACWVDVRKNSTMKACKKCGSRSAVNIVIFARSEYNLFENPGRVKVRAA